MTRLDMHAPSPLPRHLALAVLVAGGLAVCLPVLWDLYQVFWSRELNSHGPIVLAMTLYLFVVKTREALTDEHLTVEPSPRIGGVWFVLGGLLYLVGRTQAVLVVEMAALIPMTVGVFVALWGTALARRLWFAFFFLAFAIPLPGSIVDVLTQPLKIGVSVVAEHVLFALGYPIARAGVVLYVGPYQLLVADACAGLNSLFTLEALGLLYLNVVRHPSTLRNILLAILIVPVSFISNTLRVVVLALISFYLGDAAAQGFLHEFSGIVLFLSALFFIIGLDALARRFSAWVERRG